MFGFEFRITNSLSLDSNKLNYPTPKEIKYYTSFIFFFQFIPFMNPFELFRCKGVCISLTRRFRVYIITLLFTTVNCMITILLQFVLRIKPFFELSFIYIPWKCMFMFQFPPRQQARLVDYQDSGRSSSIFNILCLQIKLCSHTNILSSASIQSLLHESLHVCIHVRNIIWFRVRLFQL